jgi:hypothetical protein
MPDASQLPRKCAPADPWPGTILSPEEAESIYTWRCGVQDESDIGPWQPPPETIQNLEQTLAAFWPTQRDEPIVKPLGSYLRQYAGFMISGNPKVCINLVDSASVAQDINFYRSNPTALAMLPVGVCAEDYWRHVAIAPVDGGVLFCGVMYDVTSSQLSELNCNGL